jgi:hypothetical protein
VWGGGGGGGEVWWAGCDKTLTACVAWVPKATDLLSTSPPGTYSSASASSAWTTRHRNTIISAPSTSTASLQYACVCVCGGGGRCVVV